MFGPNPLSARDTPTAAGYFPQIHQNRLGISWYLRANNGALAAGAPIRSCGPFKDREGLFVTGGGAHRLDGVVSVETLV
jgi:hypothetical protein